MDANQWLKVNRSLLGETALLGLLSMGGVAGGGPVWEW